ncbi:MAG: hypothetical protein KBD66_00630 [Candidatus Doudnabacteria bacterium]|nr:hypothetical protein [Candidatus Doudnabacteria bacterium]
MGVENDNSTMHDDWKAPQEKLRSFRQDKVASRKDFRIEHKGVVTTIETPAALYVVVYAQHTTPDKPESIPDNADGVFLEYPRNWTAITDGYAHFQNDKQYGGLLKSLKQRGVPIYFADADVNVSIVLPVEFGAIVGETVLGLKLFKELSKGKEEVDKTNLDKIGRRAFLKKTGLAAMGAYLTVPAASLVTRIISHETKLGHGVSSEMVKKTHQVHPESLAILTSLRNAVIAFKEQVVAEAVGNRPTLGTVIGSLHVGIEDSFQSSQNEKLDYIRKFKPFLHKLIVTPETFFTIRANYPNGEVKNLVVQELKDLWERD